VCHGCAKAIRTFSRCPARKTLIRLWRRVRSPGGKTYPSPENTMSDLIQKSGAANAAEGYGAYCASHIGGRSSGTSTPFVLPDYDEEQNSGGGENHPEGNLAEQYDLMRHLGSDRSTSSEASSAARSTNKPSPGTPTLETPSDSPALSSSRAIFGATASAHPVTTASATPGAEKNAGTRESPPQNPAGNRTAAADIPFHSLDNKELANTFSLNGTHIAATATEMTRHTETVERIQTSPESGLAGTIHVIRKGGGNLSGQDNPQEKRERRQNENGIVANAGALSVMDDTTGSSTNASGEAVKLPRMQQISDAIMEQMERMASDPGNNSVSLKLDMADGSKLNLRLRWKGNHVTATFGEPSLREEIENGWASLTLKVGNTGMQLEPPTFGENHSTALDGYYA
jgi:hypothetical protein